MQRLGVKFVTFIILLLPYAEASNSTDIDDAFNVCRATFNNDKLMQKVAQNSIIGLRFGNKTVTQVKFRPGEISAVKYQPANVTESEVVDSLNIRAEKLWDSRFNIPPGSVFIFRAEYQPLVDKMMTLSLYIDLHGQLSSVAMNFTLSKYNRVYKCAYAVYTNIS